jgi:hypothetical protein
MNTTLMLVFNLPATTMSGKWNHPETSLAQGIRPQRRPSIMVMVLCALAATLTAVLCNTHFSAGYGSEHTFHRIHQAPHNAQLIISQCAALNALPGPPVNFLAREVSDRFEPGTKPTLIRNATIWTGAHNGTEVVFGDILLDGGIIKGIGEIPDFKLASVTDDLVTIDANGAWLTPGIGWIFFSFSCVSSDITFIIYS